jgi:hypothetical protein
MDKQLPVHGPKTFEELKQSNQHGAECRSARNLQPMLGYSQWRWFEEAVKRAMTSCETSGNSAEHHFAGAGKPITGGKGALQAVDGYHLSRFACYLIARSACSFLGGCFQKTHRLFRAQSGLVTMASSMTATVSFIALSTCCKPAARQYALIHLRLTISAMRTTTKTTTKAGTHSPPYPSIPLYPPIQPPPAPPFIMFPFCAIAAPLVNKGSVPTIVE